MATPPASISSDPIWDTSISKEMLEKLAELTLEEKVQLLSGASSVETNAVPRLDISALKVRFYLHPQMRESILIGSRL